MRRITLWLLSTVAAVVLLFSYRTSLGNAGTQDQAQDLPQGSEASDTPTTEGSGSAGGSTATGARTFNGGVIRTDYGPVQVRITVSDNKITKVTTPQKTNDGARSDEINARSLPILIEETLKTQSAKIDSVSGATATSSGYKQSLQSALDAANLG